MGMRNFLLPGPLNILMVNPREVGRAKKENANFIFGG
jgi:hypothetical protein